MLTHLSKDEVLHDIYLSGKDVHSMTAVGMWNRSNNENIPYEEFEYRRNMYPLFQDKDYNFVEDKFHDQEHLDKWFEEKLINTKDPEILHKDAMLGYKYDKIRKKSKTVNFGVLYGMSSKTLAARLEIPEQEAEEYIQSYFETYPKVKTWMAEQRKFLLKYKYSKTILGRKRRLYPELGSGERWLIESGIRKGINASVQGTSADMTKKASIDMQPLLKELDSYILLWIHDEVLIDVPENIGSENLQRIADIMCNAIPLTCGMRSDIEVGKKWGQRMNAEEIDILRSSIYS